VVPQPDGLGLGGQAADHRAEERDAGRGLELDDRRPDVLAGQCEGLVRLAPDLGIVGAGLQCVGEPGRPARLGQDRLDGRTCAALVAVGAAGIGGGVEDPGADGRVQRLTAPRPCSARVRAATRNSLSPAV